MILQYLKRLRALLVALCATKCYSHGLSAKHGNSSPKGVCGDIPRNKRSEDYSQLDDLPDGALIRGRTLEEIFEISEATRFRLQHLGVLKPVRIGHSTRYRVGDLRRLIENGGEVA